jgi:hypothetical protein
MAEEFSPRDPIRGTWARTAVVRLPGSAERRALRPAASVSLLLPRARRLSRSPQKDSPSRPETCHPGEGSFFVTSPGAVKRASVGTSGRNRMAPRAALSKAPRDFSFLPQKESNPPGKLAGSVITWAKQARNP